MVQVFPWQRPYIIRGYYITIVVHLMWGGLTSYDETNLRSCCESVFWESSDVFRFVDDVGLEESCGRYIIYVYIYLHVKSWKVVVKVQFQALDSCKFKLFAGLVLSSSVRIIWDYIYIQAFKMLNTDWACRSGVKTAWKAVAVEDQGVCMQIQLGTSTA